MTNQATGGFDHALGDGQTRQSFESAIMVLAEEAIHCGYTPEEVATVLRREAEKLERDPDANPS